MGIPEVPIFAHQDEAMTISVISDISIAAAVAFRQARNVLGGVSVFLEEPY